MKRALVTGASGFVGANLVRRLISDGYETHAVCRNQSDKWRLQTLQGQFRLHELSLTEAEQLQACMKTCQPDWIFHLAAHGAYSWQNSSPEIIASNVTATVNVLQCAEQVGVKAFVAAGSSSEYGFKSEAAKETDWLDPNSEYSVMKACATHLCRLYAARKALNIAVLRLYSVYGPYEDERRFIPTLIAHGLKNQLPPLVAPDIARDLVYVDDVVDAFIMAAQALDESTSRPTIEPGSVFNVGLGKQFTIKEVVELASEIMNIKELPAWGTMTNRQWDTQIWLANNDKITRELGWSPKFDLRKGLSQTIEWNKERIAKASP